MNQNFSFSSKFGEQYVGMLKSGEKDMTNRKASEFRAKCNIGDIMYRWLDQRSPEREKLGDNKVKNRIYWEIENIPHSEKEAKKRLSPRECFTWYEFAIKDGFPNWESFVEYFLYSGNYGLGIFCFIWS